MFFFLFSLAAACINHAFSVLCTSCVSVSRSIGESSIHHPALIKLQSHRNTVFWPRTFLLFTERARCEGNRQMVSFITPPVFSKWSNKQSACRLVLSSPAMRSNARTACETRHNYSRKWHYHNIYSRVKQNILNTSLFWQAPTFSHWPSC